VRDRALCLVEDFGRGLPLHSYKEAYESLLVRAGISTVASAHMCMYVWDTTQWVTVDCAGFG
jgi:hypothetical protein